MAQINAGQFEQSWANVAPESKDAVARQLKANQTTPEGRKLVTEFFQVSESELLRLTPEQYYVMIMKKGYDPKAPPAVIKSVTEGPEVAVINWVKGNRSGSSTMVRNGNRWLFKLDSIAGQ
jgi:hypothetical protein